MIEKLDIEKLIPHRGGMCLIDAILSVDQSHAATISTVKSDWPRVTADGLGPLLLIELAAQTAGVCFGWNELQKPVEQREEAKGWLVGIKSAVFYIDDLCTGSSITIRTETVLAVDHYKEVSARAYLEESLLADIHLQVMQAHPEV
jgi:predicted hotdog family 3-hydroxylacyl-ACP dehydratase